MGGEIFGSVLGTGGSGCPHTHARAHTQARERKGQEPNMVSHYTPLRGVVTELTIVRFFTHTVTNLRARSGNAEVRRPDMVINYPSGHRLIVDAKTPLGKFSHPFFYGV